MGPKCVVGENRNVFDLNKLIGKAIPQKYSFLTYLYSTPIREQFYKYYNITTSITPRLVGNNELYPN